MCIDNYYKSELDRHNEFFIIFRNSSAAWVIDSYCLVRFGHIQFSLQRLLILLLVTAVCIWRTLGLYLHDAFLFFLLSSKNERFFSAHLMDLLPVLFQVANLRESIATDVTFKRACTCMFPKVILDVAGFFELLKAFIYETSKNQIVFLCVSILIFFNSVPILWHTFKCRIEFWRHRGA